jgi:hypothetical protein
MRGRLTIGQKSLHVKNRERKRRKGNHGIIGTESQARIIIVKLRKIPNGKN